MKKSIPLSVPNFRGNELKYVTNAIRSEWVSTAGFYVNEFEESIARYVGSNGAVACQSGTAGLHLALLACGVGKEDEVIVPSLTFIAAVNPVKYVGAEPIFIDCDDGLTINACKLERFCKTNCDVIGGKLINRKTGKQIKAVIVVHIFGNMADMVKICAVAQKYHLKIIEDATEALGTYYTEGIYQNHFAGVIGDIGVYSFNGNKIITTGGGGMIVSKNKDYLDYCRYLAAQAKDDMLYFVHDKIGYNYRMTNLQAALGLAQLEQLEDFIGIKAENYRFYNENGIPLLKFRDDIRPNYWFYSYFTAQRDELLRYLNSENIQTRPIWKLVSMQKPYQTAQSYQIELAEYYYQHILNLPCSSNLTKEEIQKVVFLLKYKEQK